ncbi:MAG: type II toxin-antitoxin system RelE/ParE family toxin [Candidatus Korobacteraceae bacterium]|jgi:toxin ParE1/3/4
MKIRLTPRASQQLLSAYEYLQATSASAAASQMKRIFNSIDLLERFPLAGRKGRIAGTREMVVPRTPFIVAYAIVGKEIQVLAILHAAQRWPESL